MVRLGLRRIIILVGAAYKLVSFSSTHLTRIAIAANGLRFFLHPRPYELQQNLVQTYDN